MDNRISTNKNIQLLRPDFTNIVINYQVCFAFYIIFGSFASIALIKSKFSIGNTQSKF